MRLVFKTLLAVAVVGIAVVGCEQRKEAPKPQAPAEAPQNGEKAKSFDDLMKDAEKVKESAKKVIQDTSKSVKEKFNDASQSK